MNQLWVLGKNTFQELPGSSVWFLIDMLTYSFYKKMRFWFKKKDRFPVKYSFHYKYTGYTCKYFVGLSQLYTCRYT